VNQLPVDDPQRRRRVDLLNQIVTKAIEHLSLNDMTPEQLADPGLSPRVENAVGDIVEKMAPLPIGFDAEPITKEAVAELVGAGPVDEQLADELVQEVAVTSHDRIYVDRGPGPVLIDKVFSSPAGVLRAIHRLATRAGAKIAGSLTELRLETGALLQVALPPHARVPSFIVKRSRKTGGRLQDLVNQGVLSAGMSELLEMCMRERRNLIVSGYGRGVMIGALGGATSAAARVVTVEPVSELDLSGTAAGWIGLIGRGHDTRNVLALAVRLHPDHLMITDVRGPEALDVAAALCGGQGVVVGVDAASSRDAISRLESLSRLSGESPPRKALREELAQGIHLAVHVGRTAGGAHRVMEISEVTLGDEGGVELVPIFSFKPEGGDGQFVSTGHVPAFAG
jgi:pilus assembly protein CpaF